MLAPIKFRNDLFAEMTRELNAVVNPVATNRNEAQNSTPLSFGPFSSWEDFISPIVNLSNEQIADLTNNKKIRCLICVDTQDTVAAETVVLINSKVADISAKNVIAINSTISVPFINVENLYMYGGELSAQHVVASKNAILGSYKIIKDGSAEPGHDIMPLLNPELQKAFLSVLQFAVGPNNTSGVDLEFGEVKVAIGLTVFASPLEKVEVSSEVLNLPFSISLEHLQRIKDMLPEDLSALTKSQLLWLKTIITNLIDGVNALLKSCSLVDNQTKKQFEQTFGDKMPILKELLKQIDNALQPKAPTAVIPTPTVMQHRADVITDYINCGKTVDPACNFATHGKKVGSAKWVSYILSSYFNSAMTNVQDKSVLLQLVQTSIEFGDKVLAHIAMEKQYLV